MPTMQNLSEWLIKPIGKQERLFCAVFIELNKPHVKILDIAPGRLFHARILTYLKNVAISEVATQELRRAFVAQDRIEMQIALMGIYSIEISSSKEIRRGFNSKVMKELVILGNDYEPWFGDYQSTNLNLKASFKIVVNKGEVESIEPSDHACQNCESAIDIEYLVKGASQDNSDYFKAYGLEF